MKKVHKPIYIAIVAAIVSGNTIAESFTLEEVVVTAQKRAENLQDVPISVSAMDGNKIAESVIPDMENFAAYIPNFSVNTSGYGETISIRGIQSGGLTSSIEQSVGTFSDGIYRGRGAQSRFAFLDVGLVEVLRGPQSTLFGKNTIGGALNITSATPTEEFEGQLSAMYEVQHEETELQGYVSGPLSDTLRARLAFMDRSLKDGWVDNTYYDHQGPEDDEAAARLSFDWDASEDLTIKLKVEHGEWDNKGGAAEETVVSPSLQGAYALLGLSGDLNPENGKTTIGNNTPGIDYGAGATNEGDFDEIALRADYDLASGTLTAIYGYSAYEKEYMLDLDSTEIDGLGLEDYEEYDQNSFELRYVSDLGEGFEFLTGLYYQESNFDYKNRTNINVDPLDSDSLGPLIAFGLENELGMLPAVAQATAASVGQFTRASTLDQESDSWAAFFQGTKDLSETVTLTLGVRYGEEKKKADQSTFCAEWDSFTVANTAANCNAVSLALAEFTPHNHEGLEQNEYDWTYSAILQWDLTEDVMVYGRISNGTKAGGFNALAFSANPEEAVFDQEKVKSFEIGSKMMLLDNTAEINVAAFHMDYSDLQAAIFTGTSAVNVENAASATIQGIELDGRWQLTEELLLAGSIGYVDFEFDEYPNAGCTATQKTNLGFSGLFTAPPAGTTSGNATAIGVNPLTGMAASCEQDLSGGTNGFTPEVSASLSLEHEIELSGSLFLRTVFDVNYTGEHYTVPDNDPLTEQDAYALFNLAITLGAQSGKWDVSLIGRNITDKEYHTYSNDIPFMYGSHVATKGREADYAIRARVNF
ncbi:TonB-dependent receptor [Maricurvus nonylphenolicus]|uniref:TonB-dependent receptor n=1 Tax=Maricurvus nonylphenolicus TaxID=1008307 RepID=UPI0036F34756